MPAIWWEVCIADLVALRRVDTPRDVYQLGIVGAVSHERRHFDGLVMMRDHVLHEPHVIRRVTGPRNPDRLCGADLARRIAGRARLEYGHIGECR
jgi:hypothetical protein